MKRNSEGEGVRRQKTDGKAWMSDNQHRVETSQEDHEDETHRVVQTNVTIFFCTVAWKIPVDTRVTMQEGKNSNTGTKMEENGHCK